MGTKQSIYEKPGTLGYYKFNSEEYTLVKRIWSEIEVNPQFHGNAYFRSFCETYPQYVKFFTLEPTLPMNFDARTMAKFSLIMETMGYLLLDLNDKPKQLDRFVGYIAMVHKDMRLDEQDMRNLVSSLFEYLSQTYPRQMTAQCWEAMAKYMNSIIKELSKKMEIFRSYDVIQPRTAIRSKLSWELCIFFGEPLIFGKTKFYWDEWKKQWDARLNEWALNNTAVLNSIARLSTDEEDTVTRSRTNNDESETSILQRKASTLTHKRRTDSDVSASRLALLSLSGQKTSKNEIEHSPSCLRRRSAYRVGEHHERSQCSVRLFQKFSEVTSSRERHRIKNLVRDAIKSEADAIILHRRLKTNNHIAANRVLSESISKRDDKETMNLQYDCVAAFKPYNTARKRRRERFNSGLQ